MTRTEELLKLAEAAKAGPWKITEDSLRGKDEAWCHWHRVGPFELMGKEANDNDKFISAANPETIKQLVELVRLQHKAMNSSTGRKYVEAIAAFEKFDKGEK